MKCGGLKLKEYDQLKCGNNGSWICVVCLFQVLPQEISFNSLNDSLNDSVGSNSNIGDDANESLLVTLWNHRQAYPDLLLMAHLNINSVQNKFDELKLINNKLRAGILVLTETKIDATYPDSQFKISNYRLYRKDRVKGGGGILAYISTMIPFRRLNLTKSYRTIETLPIEVKLGDSYAVVLGLYRPPHNMGVNYYETLEDELNEITTWACSQCQTIIIMGDLNLDRLKPSGREGKMLIDLEEVHELICWFNQPTRVTTTSQTLLDVILVNSPNSIKVSGLAELGLSDHRLVVMHLYC